MLPLCFFFDVMPYPLLSSFGVVRQAMDDVFVSEKVVKLMKSIKIKSDSSALAILTVSKVTPQAFLLV